MSEEFNDATVITIAHRLNTIMHSDLIMVMNDGALAELQLQEEEVRVMRDERRSELPVAELLRRAEKDRDTAAAKLTRTEQQLEDNQEQQRKLAEKADQLRELHEAQSDKLERFKQQVAYHAQDEAGNVPLASASAAADKQKQANETNAALRSASGAKAELERLSSVFEVTNAEVARALLEGRKAIDLAKNGRIQEAEEAAEKARALLNEAKAKRAAAEGTGTEELLDLMDETESTKDKKARTA